MKRLFVLTPQARNDLKEILLDIAEDDPDTAERIRLEFFGRLQTVGQSSGIGHYHTELLSRKYRFWNFYSYVVAYVWEARLIQIICVVHGARDLAVFLSLRVAPAGRPIRKGVRRHRASRKLSGSRCARLLLNEAN